MDSGLLVPGVTSSVVRASSLVHTCSRLFLPRLRPTEVLQDARIVLVITRMPHELIINYNLEVLQQMRLGSRSGLAGTRRSDQNGLDLEYPGTISRVT